jgi:hypothetical protein
MEASTKGNGLVTQPLWPQTVFRWASRPDGERGRGDHPIAEVGASAPLSVAIARVTPDGARASSNDGTP